ncbi:hypothetical protein [Methanobacterium formicicum]|mgnify:CR=1 FL=1|uniref:hypothetical protein n=1 Tax=Methanobacterium formicicum TaxID=2162 RepID=UPI002492DFF7|nr:hypothetical protein [Methanobacterium formicicum]
MHRRKIKIILIVGFILIGLMLFSTIFISLSGDLGEDCSSCVNCTDCYIGINSTEEAKLFDQLDGIVKNYVAEKENITDQSMILTSIKFKSKEEAFVSATVNNKSWDGTWKYFDNQWNPGEDFKSS